MPGKNLRNKIDKLERWDLFAETDKIINEYQEFINDMIRAQMAEGKDGKDQPVTLFGRTAYADATVFDKDHGNYPALGKITDYITNYLTGEFYNTLHTAAAGRVFKTWSDVPYFDDIIERSGDDILRLNPEHRAIFEQEILKPELIRRYLLL